MPATRVRMDSVRLMLIQPSFVKCGRRSHIARSNTRLFGITFVKGCHELAKQPEEPAHDSEKEVWIPAHKGAESKTAKSARITCERAEQDFFTCSTGERAVEKLDTEQGHAVISAIKNNQ